MKKIIIVFILMILCISFVSADEGREGFFKSFFEKLFGKDRSIFVPPRVIPIDEDFFDNFRDWEQIYTYVDDTSEIAVTELHGDLVEVKRTYAWRDYFKKLYSANVKIMSYNNSDNYTWYGSRLGIINPQNTLERYEIRFYPTTENKIGKLQVNYVDRTNRTGIESFDEINTISEILQVTDCNIKIGEWYWTSILKQRNGKWKVMVYSVKNPSCIIKFKDKRIESKRYAIGIQSAGKGVVSRFNKVGGI